MRRILLIVLLVVGVVVGLVWLGRGSTPATPERPAASGGTTAEDCEEKPPPDQFTQAACDDGEPEAKPAGTAAGS